MAEFVENNRILDLLIELEVDYAQGYLTGIPKPLAILVDELLVSGDQNSHQRRNLLHLPAFFSDLNLGIRTCSYSLSTKTSASMNN